MAFLKLFPLSLGCKDPVVNMTSRRDTPKIFHLTGCSEGVEAFLILDEHLI